MSNEKGPTGGCDTTPAGLTRSKTIVPRWPRSVKQFLPRYRTFGVNTPIAIISRPEDSFCHSYPQSTSPQPLLIDTVTLRSDPDFWHWDPTFAPMWRRSGHADILINERTGRKFPYGRYLDEPTGWTVDMKGGFLFLSGSVRSLLHGYNFRNARICDLPKLTDSLLDLSDRLGLHFFFDELRLSRVDMAMDFKLDYDPLLMLQELGKLSTIGRMIQLPSQELRGLSYLLWTNRERSLVLYDKSAQAHKKGKPIPDGYWLRCEHRLLTARSCTRAGFTDYGELSNVSRQRWAWVAMNRLALHLARRDGLDRSHVERAGVDRVLDSFTSADRFADRYMMMSSPSRPVSTFLENIGGIRAYEQFLRSRTADRKKVTRELVYMNDALAFESVNATVVAVNPWQEYERDVNCYSFDYVFAPTLTDGGGEPPWRPCALCGGLVEGECEHMLKDAGEPKAAEVTE